MKLLLNLFEHRHKWQTRSVNSFGNPMYRICLKCRETQHRVNLAFEPEKWEKCEPIKEFDNQFDENDNYIFKSKR
jgi:hypothetical protein